MDRSPALAPPAVANHDPNRGWAGGLADAPAVVRVAALVGLGLRFSEAGLLALEAAAGSEPRDADGLAARLDALALAVVPDIPLGAGAPARLGLAVFLARHRVLVGGAVAV